jgi:outer membrane protein assembly factor BamB
MKKHLISLLVLFLMVSSSLVGVSNLVIDDSSVVQEDSYQYITDWSVHLTNETLKEEINGPFYNTVESVSEPSPLSGPMDSPWSMFGHDVVHTCRSPYSTEHNTGVEVWRVRGDSLGSVWGSALTDNNGIIYFGTKGSDSSLYALYPNGTRKWKFPANGLIWATPAISEEGIMYITTWGGDRYFYALNLDDGTEEWSIKIEASSTSSPSIAEDGTIYFGDDDNIIYALNPDGTEKWRYTTGYNVNGAPAICIQDGTIYIGSGDNYLYALYPNGTLRWRFETGDHIKGSASIAPDGTIYIPSFDGYLYALYPNGTLRWRVSTGDSLAAAGIALGKLGTIYVGTEMLRAYNPDGTLKWMMDAQGYIDGTAPAVSADGTIYVSAGNCLVAINPDGTEKWRNVISDEQVRSSPSIGLDDRVYVGSTYSEYGYLFAFGVFDPDAPTAPTIIGRIRGTIEKSYDYIFRSVSPIGNDVFYQIDWGDGKITEWLGPYDSGESIVINHIWYNEGNYNIQARAKDIQNLWGPWGELDVTMPYSYEPQFPYIHWLLERFPNAFPLLRYLVGFNQYL